MAKALLTIEVDIKSMSQGDILMHMDSFWAWMYHVLSEEDWSFLVEQLELGELDTIDAVMTGFRAKG